LFKKFDRLQTQDEKPPAKITKLAIVEDREEDKYEHTTTVKCWKCDSEKGSEIPEAVADPKVLAPSQYFLPLGN
jgi:ubiquitin carboxyl-terminal hydrolase 5/13